MKESILLIEDEPALQSTLGLRLRGEGYIVETANDGTEGFEKATTSPFDLIILDVMLPDRNGFDGQSHWAQARSRRLRHKTVQVRGTDCAH
jgi:DNA-binding response OmpR family regulator